MDLLLNIVLFGIAVLMAVKVMLMGQRNKKAKKIIDIVNSVDDKDAFYKMADEMINGKDAEFSNKAKVLKLWGMAYHNDLKHFEEVMDDIDVDVLIDNRKGKNKIEANEDSFFYLYLAIGNMLEGLKRRDIRKKLDEKMSAYDERLSDTFVFQLHEAVNSFYDHTGDRGQAFYERILEGDYPGVRYSKSLIGLYKSIATAHLAVLYREAKNTEKFEECVPYVENFMEYGVGRRWLKVIHLTLPKKETKPEDQDKEVFTITEESAKKAKSAE